MALLDLVATKKVLDRLAKASKYRPVSVGKRTEPMASDTPLEIIPEKRFEEVPAPFALVVPGGVDALKAMGDERLLDYLRFASYGAEVVLSVSTGAFLLAAAGLLETRQATTHPAYGGLLEKLGVNYVSGYSVEDGKFLTTAGVSGGIDATLELGCRQPRPLLRHGALLLCGELADRWPKRSVRVALRLRPRGRTQDCAACGIAPSPAPVGTATKR